MVHLLLQSVDFLDLNITIWVIACSQRPTRSQITPICTDHPTLLIQIARYKVLFMASGLLRIYYRQDICHLGVLKFQVNYSSVMFNRAVVSSLLPLTISSKLKSMLEIPPAPPTPNDVNIRKFATSNFSST